MSTSSPTKVGIKTGTFYLSQDKDGGNGWSKQEFLNPQTKEPMVKYHKEISIEGELVHVGFKEDKYKGECLTILVKGENETFSLEVPAVDEKGVKATNQYFNSLVGSLETLKKGDKIKMFVNSKNKDKNDKLYKNIVVLREDNTLVKSTFSFSDVPAWNSKKTKNAFGKEVTEYDPTPTNNFYITKFMSIVENWKSANPKQEPAKPSTPKEAQPKNAVPTATPAEAFAQAEEEDDLPF
jgi:hypothetical protein